MAVTIRVLLFAQLAERAGATTLTLRLDDDATVGDALAALAAEHEAIAALRGRIAVAVDEVYRRPDTVLGDGQTLALIPPVSGG